MVLNGQALPLTGRQKWDLALHEAVNPFYFGWAFVIGGGYSESVYSNSGYGWGPSGYFKRVGANSPTTSTEADRQRSAAPVAAPGPALLPQGDRLHQESHLGGRSLHGRMPRRQREDTVHVSNVLGNYISGAISNAYHPADQRGVALTLENGTEVTLFGALGGQFSVLPT